MVVPVRITDISLSNVGFVVFLENKQYEKTLPIFIGVPEAQAIAVQFNKISTPRPLTHDLLKTMLTLLDCKISKIVVNDLVDNTYYAKIFMETKNNHFQIDSRPSDAIALALRFEIPMFVDEKVMNIGAVNMKNNNNIETKKDEPKSKIEELQEQLKSAVAEEAYEEAARLRDEIKKLSGNN